MALGLSRDDVLRARERLGHSVRKTPCLRLQQLEGAVPHKVWAKCENLQWIGAFKARGALHKVGRLSQSERERGLITYSSGNHAQAVALAAQRFGTRAQIAMPKNAPRLKIDAVRRLGAEIHFAGTTSLQRRERALELQAESRGIIIEPFDDPDIICGQGTATLELLEQLEEAGESVDVLVIPVGGGGLLAGACLATQGTKLRIVAVEPVGCDSMGQSLRAGQPTAVGPGPTIADGLKPTVVGQLNFEIAQTAGVECVTVDDQAILAALRALAERAQLQVEPSGAAPLAALLTGHISVDERVAMVISGGNIDPHAFWAER